MDQPNFHVNTDYGYHIYSAMSILPSGQTIRIEFSEDETKKKWYFHIYLVTMDKRKSEGSTRLHCTGKDGLLGLLWAKNKIEEFEEFIKKQKSIIEHSAKPIVIYCWWDDNRRRNVYARGLRSLGYKYGIVFGQKVLYKEIATNEC